MAIPESQLDTWSHQGSITQSSTTYSTIKKTLESTESAFAAKDYSIFLQGSYGNDTNIYSESDVDIVIRLNSCFYHDLEMLPDDQKAAFKKVHPDANYCYFEFKKDVLAFLEYKYGDSVKSGNKAIKIDANGSRRNADVLVCAAYRRYYKFLSTYDESHNTGICFHSANNARIANYPKQHSENCTAKHQTTNKWFKPMVRILKNMRSKLVENKMIEAGVAPSYYIEGLLYNVPTEKFGTSYGDSFVNCITWILEADRSKFVCANEQYLLLHETSPVTWRDPKCTEFLKAVCELWTQW
jgi:hypothetical protein